MGLNPRADAAVAGNEQRPQVVDPPAAQLRHGRAVGGEHVPGGALGVHSSLFLAEVLLHDALSLAVRHLELVAGKHILDGLCEFVYIEVAGTHLGQLLSYS